MAFATVEAATTESKVRVATGEYLEAFGCLDHAGTPAIYGKTPILLSSPTDGTWEWATA